MAEEAKKKDPELGSYQKVLFDLVAKNYGIDFNDVTTVNKAIARINVNLSQETGNRPNAEEDLRRDKAMVQNFFEKMRGGNPGGPHIWDAPDYATVRGYR